MPKKEKTPASLHTSLALSQEIYSAEQLPVHLRYGVGLRFHFGATACDVFPQPRAKEVSPFVLIRTGKNRLAFADVTTVAPMGEGKQGILIASPEHSVWLQEDGSYYHEYRPNDVASQPQQENPQKKEPQEYKRGEFVVGSVPVPVTTKPDAPLRMTVYEKLDPADQTKEKAYEVKIYSKQVAKVKALDLKPGDKVFLVGAVKHWTEKDAKGTLIERECLNLAGNMVKVDNVKKQSTRRHERGK